MFKTSSCSDCQKRTETYILKGKDHNKQRFICYPCWEEKKEEEQENIRPLYMN